MIRVTKVASDSCAADQEFTITVVRGAIPMVRRELLEGHAPVTDLPEDVRRGLQAWLES